jgi:aryl-alcohol dehydrogenase-like predicted oxidoreductase
LIEISNDRGCSVAAVALAWLRANPLVSTPLASATNQKQLSEIMQLIDLSADEISRLNLASDKTR